MKKEIAVVNLREIIHQYEHNRITLPKNNNVYLVFSPVYNNYYAENMYVIERNHKVFFEFDIPSILTLNFKTFQIIFYDSVLSKHSVNHVFLSPTSIINFTSKKPSYDDTRRSGRDNELLQRAQNDL